MFIVVLPLQIRVRFLEIISPRHQINIVFFRPLSRSPGSGPFCCTRAWPQSAIAARQTWYRACLITAGQSRAGFYAGLLLGITMNRLSCPSLILKNAKMTAVYFFFVRSGGDRSKRPENPGRFPQQSSKVLLFFYEYGLRTRSLNLRV